MGSYAVLWGPIWGAVRSYWVPFGSYWLLLGHIGSFWVLLGPFAVCCVVKYTSTFVLIGQMNPAQIIAGRTEIIPLAPYNPQHFTRISRANIQHLWELYQAINKFEQLTTTLERIEDVKMKLIDAFKGIRRCPLILAMEMNQDGLVKFSLDRDMLYLCNCAKIISMVNHSVAMYQFDTISYFKAKIRFLPKGLNLDAACSNDQLANMREFESKSELGKALTEANFVQSALHLASTGLAAGLPNGGFNNQLQAFAAMPLPFPGLPNYLQAANLQAANLQAANMQAANLQAANMQAANMQAANLHAAIQALPIGVINNPQGALPFPNNGALHQALGAMPIPPFNPNAGNFNNLPGLLNPLAIGAFNNLPNNPGGLINNQPQQPALPPIAQQNNPAAAGNNQPPQPAMQNQGLINNPAGVVNNQPQQAAVQNPGMANNPAGGINNQNPGPINNPGGGYNN